MAAEFCPSGYVVFAIDYRLSRDARGKWPAQIEDVEKALMRSSIDGWIDE